MSMKSKFKAFFQVKKPATSEWIMLFAVIVMIVIKMSSPTRPNKSHAFFNEKEIDLRYDYVEPQVDVIPQW